MHVATANRPPLPNDRENVRFVVVGHRGSYVGVYEHECFRSRWASYRVDQVSAWSRLPDAPRDAPLAHLAPDARYWSERAIRGR